MFSDIFKKNDVLKLLGKKKIWFFGSSNMRAIYKDLLWLMNSDTLAPQVVFRTKNEESYMEDKRLSNGKIHNGKYYVETREYKDRAYIMFHFLTRLYLDSFIKIIDKTDKRDYPDVIFINSTLWDLTRWGSTEECIKNFKENMLKTFTMLTEKFPDTRIVWKTCLPLSRTASGAIFIDEVKCVVPMLPWHIVEANRYASVTATFFNIDTLDIHHYMRMRGYLRVKDGIHWDSTAVRYMTNVFLTHLALCFDFPLPNFKPSMLYLSETSAIKLDKAELSERIEKKKSFISKLFEGAVKGVKTLNPITKAKNVIKKNKNLVSRVKNTFKSKNPNPFSNSYRTAHDNNQENMANYQNYPGPSFMQNVQPMVYNRYNHNFTNYNSVQNNYYYSALHNLDSQLRMVYSNIQNNSFNSRNVRPHDFL